MCVWGCECGGMLGYGGVCEGAKKTFLSKMGFTDMRKISHLKEGVTEMENKAQILFSLPYNWKKNLFKLAVCKHLGAI